MCLGGIGDEPATEAHHLSYRGSRFSGVYPPSSSLLGLSRSWQQDTETALIMLQGDPRYPPRKLQTHVPTRAALRTASYRVEVPVAAKAPGHPPYLPRESPRLLLTPGEASPTHTHWGDFSQERSARETVYEGYSRKVRTLPVWRESVMSLRGPENSSEVHTEQLWD